MFGESVHRRAARALMSWSRAKKEDVVYFIMRECRTRAALSSPDRNLGKDTGTLDRRVAQMTHRAVLGPVVDRTCSQFQQEGSTCGATSDLSEFDIVDPFHYRPQNSGGIAVTGNERQTKVGGAHG